MTKIYMDSKVSQTLTRAVVNGGVLSCTQTSANDVYSHSIWRTASNINQFTMFDGDSIVVPAGSTLTIWIFRKKAGGEGWTMDFDLDESKAAQSIA